MAKRIGIVGSRNFDDLGLVRRFVQSLPKDTVVISGGAKGVDKTAADEARKQGLEVVEYYPDYETYGYYAPLQRNHLIVNDSEEIHAFQLNKSRGTQHTISLAYGDKKPVTIHRSRLELKREQDWLNKRRSK